MSMRWVLVARHAHPSRSGIGAANALFLRAAAAAGWDVELITATPTPVPAGVRVTIVRAPHEPRALSRLVPELRRARALRPVVAAADHILDIHSTAGDVQPFWVYPRFERNAA